MDCTIQADGGISFSPSPLPSPSREREKNRAVLCSIGPLSLQGEGEKQSRTQLDRPPLPPGRGRKTELYSAQSAPSLSREREKNRAVLCSIGPLSLREREKNRAVLCSIGPLSLQGEGEKQS
jgi:hypothetical protein